MMRMSWLANLLLFIAAIVIAGCAAQPTASPSESVSPLETPRPVQSPLPTPEGGGEIAAASPVPPTPEPSKATMVGRVLSEGAEAHPVGETVVWLGRVFWNEDASDGAFAIETGSSPSTITDQQGWFVITDIVPGDYVFVVGNLEGTHAIVAQGNDSDTAETFVLEADTVLDVGELHVAWETLN